MAGDIKVRIVGDTSGFERSLGSAKKLSKGFSSDVEKETKKAGAGFDRMGEGADGAETRLLGLKDSVDGVSTVLKGPGEQGIAAYVQGWADLASGVANFAVPAFKKLIAGSLDQIKATVAAAAATASAVARQVAQWVILGAQATAQAARVAAAWLISIGPIAAVGAAIAGLVYLVIEHWDTIKNAIGAAVEAVKGVIGGLIDFFKKIPGWTADAFKGVAELITKPYRMAFNAIAKLWNNTVGKLKFKIPGWVPGIGGKGFDVPNIPTFDTGGIVPGPRGMPTLALVHGGETVLPTHKQPAPNSRPIEVNHHYHGFADPGEMSRRTLWDLGRVS